MSTEKIAKVLSNMPQGLTSTEQEQGRINLGIRGSSWLVPEPPVVSDMLLTTDPSGIMYWASGSVAGGIKPTQLSSYIHAGNNITITNDTLSSIMISATVPEYASSDWNASSGQPGFIYNKPDLSIYELVANKKQTVDPSSTSDYPSSKAVADYLDGQSIDFSLQAYNGTEYAVGTASTLTFNSTAFQKGTAIERTSNGQIRLNNSGRYYVHVTVKYQVQTAGTGIGKLKIQLGTTTEWFDIDRSDPEVHYLDMETLYQPSPTPGTLPILLWDDSTTLSLHAWGYSIDVFKLGGLSLGDVAGEYSAGTGISINNDTISCTVDGIPAYNSTYANNLLAVNASGTGVLWKPDAIPAYSASDSQKVLRVDYLGRTKWEEIREVPSYAVVNQGYLLGVVNNGGTVELGWTQPMGYWTQAVDNSSNHTLTAEDIAAGYVDFETAITASNTSSAITDPTYAALSWDVQVNSGQTSSVVSSIDFALGVSGGSYDTVFSDNNPAHETHKDWGITRSWMLNYRKNRVRARCNLASGATVGNIIYMKCGGIVIQVR